MTTLAVTDRVLHKVFGLGTVTELRTGGHEARVHFSGLGVTLWVASAELRRLGLDELAARPGLRPARRAEDVRLRRAGSLQFTPRRRLIEALRLGIVPEAFVPEFTFGREGERDFLLDRVAGGVSSRRGRTFIVEDEYGRGKTHFLMYLRAEALRRGYAVSFVSFDPEEVTPYRVKRVYSEAVRSLCWVRDGQALGFRELLGAHQSHLATPHPYLTPFLALRDRNRLREHHWQWLEGDRHLRRRFVHLPALLEDYVASNLYCNLLTALGSLLARIGVPAWVLLFDESESLGAVQAAQLRKKGANFLRGLILAAANRTDESADVPLVTAHAYGQEVLKNPRNGLLYSRRRRDALPYRFRPSGADPEPVLFPVFAFTPAGSEYHEEILAWVPDPHVIPLPEIGRREYRRLFHALLAAYRDAYGVGLQAEDEAVVFEALMQRFGPHIRSWIKGGVELLDLLRLQPGARLDRILAGG
jgi:hypothetical protein